MPYIALLIAGLHGLLLLCLLWPIVKIRRAEKIGLGSGGNAELQRRIRVHANFVENVPLMLVLLALLELCAVPRIIVGVLGGVLFSARVFHAIGLSGSAGYSTGRFWGTLATWIVLGTASVVAIVTAAQHLAT